MWKSIETAPHDRDIVVICRNGSVYRAWWHKSNGPWTLKPFGGWVSRDRVLTDASEPVLYVDIPASDAISTSGHRVGREKIGS